MSCGLDWKDQIGEMLRAGKTKDEIIKAFIAKYGDECKITPIMRIRGKFFQYTRRFDTMDWALLWGGVAVSAGTLFLGIYMVVRRFLNKRTKPGVDG